jgi:hypothetical protein
MVGLGWTAPAVAVGWFWASWLRAEPLSVNDPVLAAIPAKAMKAITVRAPAYQGQRGRRRGAA